MRISDWSSDVCSSDLANDPGFAAQVELGIVRTAFGEDEACACGRQHMVAIETATLHPRQPRLAGLGPLSVDPQMLVAVRLAEHGPLGEVAEIGRAHV